MEFSLQEIANYFGRPSYLVMFTRGNKTWTYTNADRNIDFAGRTYVATPMKVGSMNRTGDPQADEFTIDLPATLEVVTTHILIPPTERVGIILSRYHKDGENAVVRYNGAVDRVKRTSPLKAQVVCKTLLATMSRSGARLTWQRGCTHALYDVGCTVDKNAHAVPGVMEGVSGADVTSSALSALADGRFVGGYIEWEPEPAIVARRAITAHTGNQISLLGGAYGAAVGLPFTAYPGCPRNGEACEAFYNNLPNYGGIRHLPSRSPFDGNPVF